MKKLNLFLTLDNVYINFNKQPPEMWSGFSGFVTKEMTEGAFGS